MRTRAYSNATRYDKHRHSTCLKHSLRMLLYPQQGLSCLQCKLLPPPVSMLRTCDIANKEISSGQDLVRVISRESCNETSSVNIKGYFLYNWRRGYQTELRLVKQSYDLFRILIPVLTWPPRQEGGTNGFSDSRTFSNTWTSTTSSENAPCCCITQEKRYLTSSKL